MNRAARDLGAFLNESRKKEEESLSSKSFVVTIAKGYRYSTLISCIVGLGMWCWLLFWIQDPVAGWAFGSVGILALLVLPTCFSYRCYVDKTMMKESYFLLCFKVNRKVYWKDIEYKKAKRSFNGEPLAICLHDKGKKKRISFDYTMVGFGKVLKMTKQVPVLKR
jgi:hypothetical protein